MERYYLTQRPPLPGAIPAGAANTHTYGANGAAFPKIGKVWGFAEYESPLTPEQVSAYELTPGGPSPAYGAISEEAARDAKRMSSLSDYAEGSETDSYRRCVDKAAFLAYRKKQRIAEMYHDKIDGLLASYTTRLAENTNALNRNAASCPSILVSGGGNFPVRKKEKQSARDDTLRRERLEIDAILDRMESVGTGGISSDDPQAVEKLEAKLASLKALQDKMKAVNAFYRKNKTLDGCPDLSDKEQFEIEANWKRGWYSSVPFPPYELQNNLANIKRTQERLDGLKRLQDAPPEGWAFDGGHVDMNTDENRLQIIFDERPDEEARSLLKHNGFRWSPRFGAWQRQITTNAVTAAKSVTAALAARG